MPSGRSERLLRAQAFDPRLVSSSMIVDSAVIGTVLLYPCHHLQRRNLCLCASRNADYAMTSAIKHRATEDPCLALSPPSTGMDKTTDPLLTGRKRGFSTGREN